MTRDSKHAFANTPSGDQMSLMLPINQCASRRLLVSPAFAPRSSRLLPSVSSGFEDAVHGWRACGFRGRGARRASADASRNALSADAAGCSPVSSPCTRTSRSVACTRSGPLRARPRGPARCACLSQPDGERRRSERDECHAVTNTRRRRGKTWSSPDARGSGRGRREGRRRVSLTQVGLPHLPHSVL